MFIRQGKKLPLNKAFEVDGVQYPANWLRVSTPSERKLLRIEEVPDPIIPNEKYYIIEWNVDGSVKATPRPLKDALEGILSEINAWLSNSLSGSDWLVIRAAEGVKPVPAEIAAQRDLARSMAASWEGRAKAAKDISEIEAIALEMGS